MGRGAARMAGQLAFCEKAAAALVKCDASEQWLIGVSGGRDSVALLHFLASSGFRDLIVCHLDHRLRGAASAADARFVARLAERLGLRAIVEKCDVAALAAESRQSLETAGRAARNAFFFRTARVEKCAGIFLAHHADDQVETFLFNLFRGAGAGGLGGMRVESARTEGASELRVIRPLLAVWRAEVDEYIAAHRLKFREDATNFDGENSRSRMRQKIIPMIEQALGRGVRKAVWQAAEILRAQQEFIQAGTAVTERELSVPELRALPEAPQSALIHRWLKENGVPNLTFALVQSVRALLPTDAKIAKVNLPGGRHVRRRAKRLFVE